MLVDYHMHTEFSGDSTYPMEKMIQKAISLGINEICFTEHVDYGLQPFQIVKYEAYRKEFERCQEIYKDQITLRWGAEFGAQRQTLAHYKRDIVEQPLDFILLSCHQIDNKEFWNQDFQKGKTQKEINEEYYQEILSVMKAYKGYDCLGHLDAIRRDDPFGEYLFEETKELVKEILLLAIADGKGIEVNTSYDRYKLKDITPSRDILKLYHELGGTILTIGSDSHKEEHMGYQLEYMQKELKKIGFTSFCTYEKRQPIFHTL